MAMDQSQNADQGDASVLSCFPPSVGREVAVAVVKALGEELGNPNACSLLRTDRQVSSAYNNMFSQVRT